MTSPSDIVVIHWNELDRPVACCCLVDPYPSRLAQPDEPVAGEEDAVYCSRRAAAPPIPFPFPFRSSAFCLLASAFFYSPLYSICLTLSSRPNSRRAALASSTRCGNRPPSGATSKLTVILRPPMVAYFASTFV